MMTLTKEQLHEMYIVREMTTTQIAKTISKVPQTIGNWLRKCDIPIRQGREASMPVEPSKEQLVDLYERQQKSIDRIAKEIGSSEISIRKFLLQDGITIRDKTWKIAGHNKGQPLPAWQRKILSDLAKQRTGAKHPRFGCKLSQETKDKIAQKLKGRFRGDLNPQWKKDATHHWRKTLYARFEYKEWRKQVFARDNYTCRACLKHSNGDIQAHHILPVEDYPMFVLAPNNGITLCKRCHRSVKGKESLFIELFCELINVPIPIP